MLSSLELTVDHFEVCGEVVSMLILSSIFSSFLTGLEPSLLVRKKSSNLYLTGVCNSVRHFKNAFVKNKILLLTKAVHRTKLLNNLKSWQYEITLRLSTYSELSRDSLLELVCLDRFSFCRWRSARWFLYLWEVACSGRSGLRSGLRGPALLYRMLCLVTEKYFIYYLIIIIIIIIIIIVIGNMFRSELPEIEDDVPQ